MKSKELSLSDDEDKKNNADSCNYYRDVKVTMIVLLL